MAAFGAPLQSARDAVFENDDVLRSVLLNLDGRSMLSFDACCKGHEAVMEPLWQQALELRFPLSVIHAGEDCKKTLYAKHERIGEAAKWNFTAEVFCNDTSVMCLSLRGVDAVGSSDYPGMWDLGATFPKGVEGLAWTIDPPANALRAMGVETSTMAIFKDETWSFLHEEGTHVRAHMTARAIIDGEEVVRILVDRTYEQDSEGIPGFGWFGYQNQANHVLRIAPDSVASAEGSIVWRLALDVRTEGHSEHEYLSQQEALFELRHPGTFQHHYSSDDEDSAHENIEAADDEDYFDFEDVPQ